MNIKILLCVPVSRVFEGFPSASDLFAERAANRFSWGDNDYSLVDRNPVIDVLSDIGGCEGIIHRIKSLPPDVLIDLEH